MHFSLKLESVRIGKCQNWKVSESESVRIGKCQNWKVSELENVKTTAAIGWVKTATGILEKKNHTLL